MTITKARGQPRTPAILSREQVEQAIWRLTKWRGAAGEVDRLLRIIDEYALAHGAVLPSSVFGGPKLKSVSVSPSVIESRRSDDKRLRCNRCGHFKPLHQMQTDNRRTDSVRTDCKACNHKGVPVQEKFRGQRVYRLRTTDGWVESRRLRV